MPLFAALLKGIHLAWVGLLSNVMYYVFTVTWARRVFIVALGATFLAAVSTCVSALLSAVNSFSVSGEFAGRFTQGLGMLIPSNAVAVISCLATIWLACMVYRLKLEALRW